MQYMHSIPFFFLVALGLHCCEWAFSSCSEWRLLLVAVSRLLIVMASLVVEHRVQAAWVLEVEAHELSSCRSRA